MMMMMMKALSVVVLRAICGCYRESPVDKSGRRIAEQDPQSQNEFKMHDVGCEYRFRYITVDGHEYLLCLFDRGVGMSYSPKCQCQWTRR